MLVETTLVCPVCGHARATIGQNKAGHFATCQGCGAEMYWNVDAAIRDQEVLTNEWDNLFAEVASPDALDFTYGAQDDQAWSPAVPSAAEFARRMAALPGSHCQLANKPIPVPDPDIDLGWGSGYSADFYVQCSQGQNRFRWESSRTDEPPSRDQSLYSTWSYNH